VRRRANRVCQTRGRGVSARERTTRNRTFSGLSGYVFTLGLSLHFSLSLSLYLSLSLSSSPLNLPPSLSHRSRPPLISLFVPLSLSFYLISSPPLLPSTRVAVTETNLRTYVRRGDTYRSLIERFSPKSSFANDSSLLSPLLFLCLV